MYDFTLSISPLNENALYLKGYWQIYTVLGVAFYNLGKLNDSVMMYDRVLQLNPNND